MREGGSRTGRAGDSRCAGKGSRRGTRRDGRREGQGPGRPGGSEGGAQARACRRARLVGIDERRRRRARRSVQRRGRQATETRRQRRYRRYRIQARARRVQARDVGAPRPRQGTHRRRIHRKRSKGTRASQIHRRRRRAARVRGAVVRREAPSGCRRGCRVGCRHSCASRTHPRRLRGGLQSVRPRRRLRRAGRFQRSVGSRDSPLRSRRSRRGRRPRRDQGADKGPQRYAEGCVQRAGCGERAVGLRQDAMRVESRDCESFVCRRMYRHIRRRRGVHGAVGDRVDAFGRNARAWTRASRRG